MRAERGSTTVEMVGYGAVMLLALLIGVQAATWGLAQLACRYAANHALQVTRVQGGTVEAGQLDATATLRQIDAKLVTDPSAHATRDATTATVTVAGDAVQVIPLLRFRVGAAASGPLEVFTP